MQHPLEHNRADMSHSDSGLRPGRRILVIPNEFPLPANSGGRVDVWRRLQVLREDLGCQLALATWYDLPRDGEPSPDRISELGKIVSTYRIEPIQRSAGEILRRLSLLWRWPSHAASRWVTSDRQALLAWAQAFDPDVILLDGLYGSPVAYWLSQRLGKPVIYRSHNIEHLYMRQQLEKATRLKSRLGLRANLVRLRGLELNTVAKASAVLDISADDLLFWRTTHGFHHLQWLPPTVDAMTIERLAQPASDEWRSDLLYFGNLNTPNNVDALRFIVRDILPLVPQKNFVVRIAGSRPSTEVIHLCAEDSRIVLNPDPADMAPIVRSARTIVNPVMSGSGVNLKTVEMLFTSARLISSRVGVQGLQDHVKRHFIVCDTPLEFAKAIGEEAPVQPELGHAGKARMEAQEPFLPQQAANMLSLAMQIERA